MTTTATSAGPATAALDMSKLDPDTAALVAAVVRERDDALGRCKNYQIQAATRESLLLALQTEADKRHHFVVPPGGGGGGHHSPKPDISQAASHAFASLKSAGARLFKKRGASRHSSIDTGGEAVLAPSTSTSASASGPASGTGAAADTNDPNLARSVAHAVTTSGPQSNGGGGEGDNEVTLGYNEMLEQDLRKHESKIQMLTLEVDQLRDLNENSAAELSAARSALASHAQDYAKLQASRRVEKTLRDAAEAETQRLEEQLRLAEDAAKVHATALEEARQALHHLQDKFAVQEELLAGTTRAWEWLSRMQQVSEIQLMQAEDKRTQAVELRSLQREFDLLRDIKFANQHRGTSQHRHPQQQQQQQQHQQQQQQQQQAAGSTNGGRKAGSSRGLSGGAGSSNTHNNGGGGSRRHTTGSATAPSTSAGANAGGGGSSGATRGGNSGVDSGGGTGTATTLASPTSMAKHDPLAWLCQGSSNLDCPNVAMEGWLTKSATTKGKESHKRRYVRLRCLSTTKIALSYFAQDGGMDHLKRRLVLRPDCKVVDAHPDPLVFSLTGIDAHDGGSSATIELVLRAPAQAAKNLWVQKLRDCVEYLEHLAEASGHPVPVDELKATFCESCNTPFSTFKWRYLCYFCGNTFCHNCLDEVAPGPTGDKRRRCENCLPDMSSSRRASSSTTTLEAGRQINASSASLATGFARGS